MTELAQTQTDPNLPFIPTAEQSSLLKTAGKTITEMMLFNPTIYDRVEAMGKIMATAKTTIPQHLRGNVGDCLAVITQAMRWGIDPYACAQKTHLINGTLGYEAQLVNAVLISNAPITGRPMYEWFGEWEKIVGKVKTIKSKNGNDFQVPDWNPQDEKGLGVRITVQIKGQKEPTVHEILLSQATVRNSTLWAGDPKQQLAYLCMKRMARLYFPDVIMGVYTPDELQSAENHQGFDNAVDVTPEDTPAPEPEQAPISKADAFAASAQPTETAPVSEPVYIKTPPSSDNQRGEIPFNSLELAAEALIKAIQSRIDYPDKHKEIIFIRSSNNAVLNRIANELPEQHAKLEAQRHQIGSL